MYVAFDLLQVYFDATIDVATKALKLYDKEFKMFKKRSKFRNRNWKIDTKLQLSHLFGANAILL